MVLVCCSFKASRHHKMNGLEQLFKNSVYFMFPAIRNLTGHYYLNGNWRIDFPKKNRFVGTMFNYERRSLGLASPESITALGPITESIYIVVSNYSWKTSAYFVLLRNSK